MALIIAFTSHDLRSFWELARIREGCGGLMVLLITYGQQPGPGAGAGGR
ncbi:hypothetical protein ACFU8W_11290 [Streptomyces sp. NPDC057565]